MTVNRLKNENMSTSRNVKSPRLFLTEFFEKSKIIDNRFYVNIPPPTYTHTYIVLKTTKEIKKGDIVNA